MTAKEFKKFYDERYVSSRYDTDSHSVLTNYVIDGIHQCLVNQEKIIKMLESK